jgi:hypothetical protein
MSMEDLDRQVAQCLGESSPDFHPCTNWQQGGPIMELEGIGFEVHEEGWKASIESRPRVYFYGPTPLIAAMRCLIGSNG